MQAVELSPKAKARLGACIASSTVGGEIQRRADLQPDHFAVVASGFAPLSYRELQGLIDEVRAVLRLNGFGRNARIAVAIRNGPHAAISVVAVACSAISIPLNPQQTIGEIEMCLAALRPDGVLVAKGVDSAARRVAERQDITLIEVTQTKDGNLGFSIAAPKASAAAARDLSDEPDTDAIAFILQTSGTSDQPKLVPTRHRNMLAAAARVHAWFDLTQEDCCLSVSPVFYAHGLHVTVFAPLLSGGTIAFPKDASRFDYAEWFGNLKPTWYSAGPTLHRLVFDQLKSRADARAEHALRFILSGGAPLPRNVLEGLQQTLGVPVVEHYGSSEGMQICSNLLPPRSSKLGTVGVPLPDTIRIVGDDDRRLPVGERGEILVGGQTVVSGYLNSPEPDRVSFVDGWFRTGDIGSLDADGFLTLHGRKDDLINRGGEKISPAEIDAALIRHPAVADAAAFSVAHPRLGESVAAAVVLHPGTSVTPFQLRRFLQEHLASFKVPQQIFIRDELPKGQTGKVVRRQLTEFLQNASSTTEISAARPLDDTSVDGDLITKLTAIWERLLKTSPVFPDDDFFEKGGDSLLAMEMLLDLELLAGRPIPSSILLEAPTITRLARKLSEATDTERKHLIQLNQSGHQTPLVYFHGQYLWYGNSAAALAKLLGPDQPLLVVEPHGMGNEPIPSTIETMAADRLPLILNAQPEGPYRLCGNCLGGVVAFEVARMLIARGKTVELVIMLDTPTTNAHRSVQLLCATVRRARPLPGPIVKVAAGWTWFWCAQIQKFYNISWIRRLTAIQMRVRHLVGRGGTRDDYIPATEIAFLGRFTDARTSRYAYAMSKYKPRPLDVRVIHFSVDFAGKPWRRVSHDLEIIKSPGNHYDYDFPHIAAHIRERLMRADKMLNVAQATAS